MKIDGYLVVPESACLFPAIGGGFGVKMAISGGEELLFGRYDTRDEAERIVVKTNAMLDGVTTVRELEGKESHAEAA